MNLKLKLNQKDKKALKDFWNKSSCGERLYFKGSDLKSKFINQSKKRYKLEPFIISFADFCNSKSKKILEIGVGLGADHHEFCFAGAETYGIDLTERAIRRTKQRLELFNLKSNLSVGDAEDLDFNENIFDIVYSWGVIHHSPNTNKAVNEIYRVLKDGGVAKIMIYNKYSIVGFMLWIRYALLRLKPHLSLNHIYDKYLESPGTSAYTDSEAREMFSKFKKVKIHNILTHADLLSSNVGQRHRGVILSIAKYFFPTMLVKTFFNNFGLFKMIEAKK